jgi:hypothetical protein
MGKASTVFAQRDEGVLARVAQRRDEAHVGLELLARVLLRSACNQWNTSE